MQIEYEKTSLGDQGLIPGVKPTRTIDYLNILINRPLCPNVRQKPVNIGLFDETARNQLELFS